MFKVCFQKISIKKDTDNIGLKKVTMTNKVIRQASKYTNSVAEESRFLKQKSKKNWFGQD